MDTLSFADPSAENEALARRCESVAETAIAAIDWIGANGDLVREEGPAMARDFRQEAARARRLAIAARRPMWFQCSAPVSKARAI